jgi:hypothetical protein
MPPIIFSENIITSIMKRTYFVGISFTKLGLFFHKLAFIINIIYPLLREILYAGLEQLFAEVSELFTHAVVQVVVFVVPKTASSECILQGAKNMEVREGGGSKSGL